MDDSALNELGDHISTVLANEVVRFRIEFGELTVYAHAQQIVRVLRVLRDDPTCRFLTLIDISGVDYPNRAKRFDLVYHLLSLHQNQRVRVIIETDEDAPVPSAVPVFPNANWYEREIYDLYGAKFSGHPDLRRLITDYGFIGHPLRKDFPLTGFVELRYDDELKRVVYEPVQLQQEYRSFDFLSPWEGAKYILPGDEKAEANGRPASDKAKD